LLGWLARDDDGNNVEADPVVGERVQVKLVITRQRLIIAGFTLPLALAIGAFGFAWSGLYNVAASEGHLRLTAWFLHFVMRSSVSTHAASIDPPPGFDRPAMVGRGAGHFARGCAPCHGAPGVPPSPIAHEMLPAPPDLSKAVPKWEVDELFWIIRHGIKYAGMPAWPAQVREDEVWAVTAFLLELPGMAPESYRELAFPAIKPGALDPAPALGAPAADPATCARCHGAQGQGGPFGGVPMLAGQKASYLRLTLEDYRRGNRPSGIMGPIATFLDDRAILELAAHYEQLDTPSRPAAEADPALLQMGGALAAVGDPKGKIPACSGCHGEDGRALDKMPAYPALAGQHAPYLQQQLWLWRAGIRGGSYGNLMAAAVQNITDQQIEAVTLYYSRLRPE
jgi:cytochrome c553